MYVIWDTQVFGKNTCVFVCVCVHVRVSVWDAFLCVAVPSLSKLYKQQPIIANRMWVLELPSDDVLMCVFHMNTLHTVKSVTGWACDTHLPQHIQWSHYCVASPDCCSFCLS